MEIGVTADSPKPGPTAASAAPEGDEPHWIDSDEEEPTEENAEWSDIDIGAPDGTRG
jgi:hypothetical protein